MVRHGWLLVPQLEESVPPLWATYTVVGAADAARPERAH
jgi:hypothetical protein